MRRRKLTAYPACKPEALLAGAEFVDPDSNIPETVVVDGNLVCSRFCPNPGFWLLQRTFLLETH